MIRILNELRAVYVVGIGLHPNQYQSETSYLTLGRRTVREAIADAAIDWPMVDGAFDSGGDLCSKRLG